MSYQSQLKKLMICSFAVTCFSSGVNANISADELFSMQLEQLLTMKINTASKSSQNTVDAAAVIEVISQKDIQNFGANSLLEVLDRATSVAMSGTFFFPQNISSMRGGLSTSADHHVLLLLNGRPMRDSFTGGENFPFYTSFPVQMIKQIEIIRGAGSVLYGSNAFTGVINIITQDSAKNSTEVKLTAGSFNTRKVQTNTSVNSGDLKLSAGLHWLDEEGWDFEVYDNNANFGSFKAGENEFGLVVAGTYNNLSFNSFYINSKQDFWGSTSTWQAGTVPPTSNLGIESTRYMLDLGYKLTFSDTRYLDSNISFGSQAFSHINYDSESKNTFLELTHHWNPSDKIHWLVGTTAWYQDVNSIPGERVAPVPAFTQTWYSFYSQAEFQQTEKLKWVVGAQVNKIPEVTANTVPRLSAIYQMSNKSGFKLNYGQAFRAAYGVETHFDLVICCRDDGSNRGGLRGNPGLKPETITTYDAQYYLYNDSYQFNFTLFKSKQEDLIERERAADNVIDFINRGVLDVKGLELEYKYTFSPNNQLVSSFSYQKNETGNNQENFTLAPNRMFKLGYTHIFENKIKLAAFNSFFDDSFDNISRSPNRQALNPKASAYNMLTANLYIPLTTFGTKSDSKAYFELYGYNLLDEAVYQPEVAGGAINTNPLRAERSWYLSYTHPF